MQFFDDDDYDDYDDYDGCHGYDGYDGYNGYDGYDDNDDWTSTMVPRHLWTLLFLLGSAPPSSLQVLFVSPYHLKLMVNFFGNTTFYNSFEGVLRALVEIHYQYARLHPQLAQVS